MCFVLYSIYCWFILEIQLANLEMPNLKFLPAFPGAVVTLPRDGTTETQKHEVHTAPLLLNLACKAWYKR